MPELQGYQVFIVAIAFAFVASAVRRRLDEEPKKYGRSWSSWDERKGGDE